MYWFYQLAMSLFVYIISAMILYEGQSDRIDRILSIFMLTFSSCILLILYIEFMIR